MGQSHINQTLSNALKMERVSHAYLFTGPRGTGKTSTARLMAKAINCTDLKGTEPCNQCEICTDINDGRLIDLIEIDAASNRGIDEMRDLREKINFSPTRAKSKVYIIDEVHMLTKEAFNALLKTLEEPPSHVYFILATTEVHKIPETILSRCQRFDFRRIDDKTIVDRLSYIAKEEGIIAEGRALEMIAHHAEGGLRDAIGLFEQLTTNNELGYDHVCMVLGVSGFASIEKLFDFLIEHKTKEALNEVHELYMEGYDLNYFNKRFLEYLRKKMILSVESGKSADTVRILELINYFQDSYEQARHALIPQLPLEMAIIKSCMKIGAVEYSTEQSTSSAQGYEREHKSLDPHKEHVQPVAAKVDQQHGAEKKSHDLSDSDLNLENINGKWARLLENIESPIVKRSFQQCKPLKVEGLIVTIGFSNNFHLDKMMETPNRSAIEGAFEAVFNKHIKIAGEINKVAVAINSEKTGSERALEESVMDIFDGEIA